MGASLDIKNEIAALLAGEVESFHVVNRKPTNEITYPYATFTFGYSPNDEIDGGGGFDVTLDMEVFDRYDNTTRVLGVEDSLVSAIERETKLSDSAFLRARLERADDIQTLSDGLFRRNLQFFIRMTLRKVNQ